MNNEVEKKHGIVTGFDKFTPEMLQSMKYDTGLGMSVNYLLWLQPYYKNIAKRSPELDEFYLIDRLLAIAGTADSPVGELLTSFTPAAETYADLLAKRRKTENDDLPPTPSCLARGVGKYIDMVGKKSVTSRNFALYQGDGGYISALIDGNIPVGRLGSATLARKSKKSNTSITGYMLVLIAPWGDIGKKRFEELAVTLLTQNPCVNGAFIGNDGIIGAVSRLCDGAYIDLSVIPDVPHPCELTAVCDASHGGLILALPINSVNKYMKLAYEMKLYSAVIGSVASDENITIRHEQMRPVIFRTSFIRRMIRRSPECFVLKDEAPGTRISADANFIENENTVLSTAEASDATFFAGLDTTLTAVAGCVAAGVDYKNLCVNKSFSLPYESADPKVRGSALALILGSYRAQIEFYLADAGTDIAACDAKDAAFSVAAAGNISGNSPIPSTFGGCGLFITLLTPRRGENAMPDLEDMRHMWDYFTQTASSGHIKAARAVSGDIRGILDGMTDSGTTYVISDIPEDIPAGSILAVSDYPIQGTKIGYTVLKMSEKQEDSMPADDDAR